MAIPDATDATQFSNAQYLLVLPMLLNYNFFNWYYSLEFTSMCDTSLVYDPDPDDGILMWN